MNCYCDYFSLETVYLIIIGRWCLIPGAELLVSVEEDDDDEEEEEEEGAEDDWSSYLLWDALWYNSPSL